MAFSGGSKAKEAPVPGLMLTTLPDQVDWADVLRVVALGITLSLLATVYPSWKAARTDPVEALRHG